MNDIYKEKLVDAEIGFTVEEGSTEYEVFIMLRKMHDHELVLDI